MNDIEKNWECHLIQSELSFWQQWFETRGLDWPQDYAFRLQYKSQIQDYLAQYLDPKKKEIKILDVGSGPLTVLGKMLGTKYLNISMTDALGDHYCDLLTRYKIPTMRRPYKCRMEYLTNLLGYEGFDLVHAQNCVDHSVNPLMAINQMILCARFGGVVYLRHQLNEATAESYQGLHQWDFSLDQKGEMIAQTRGQTYAIQRMIKATWGDQVEMESHVDQSHVVSVIKKTHEKVW